MPSPDAPAQSLPVLDGRHFAVSNGANLGDGVTCAAEMVLDDIYRLSMTVPTTQLSLLPTGDHFLVDQSSETGVPSAAVYLDCALTFISADGETTDVLLLVELDGRRHVVASYMVPLSMLAPQVDYTLVGIDTETARQKLAQTAFVSFTRGTHITMGNGRQVRIEELAIGDRVLTRDSGVQQIRWIGHSTTRAVGAFAPIRIAAGAMNNTNDLIVSPDHRLFVFQRSDQIGAGQSELLIKARHLVNGDSITVMEGGFVDYFQLLFDTHQIIYAEGIAAESFLIDPRTAPAVPAELGRQLVSGGTPTASKITGVNVSRQLLDRPDAAELLRRASTR